MPKIKLRQDTIRSLEYVGAAGGKAPCIYWDAGLPGFGMRIFPNGRASCVCSYRYHMRNRVTDLGRADPVTLEQARKTAKAYVAAAADSKDPQSGIDGLREAATAKGLATQYLEQHAKLKKRSWKAVESFLNRYVIPHLKPTNTKCTVGRRLLALAPRIAPVLRIPAAPVSVNSAAAAL